MVDHFVLCFGSWIFLAGLTYGGQGHTFGFQPLTSEVEPTETVLDDEKD